MSRGYGRVERDIISMLVQNKTLTTPIMAVLVYQKPPSRLPTPAESAAVRRALSKLHKHGLVFKLGNMLQGERCSYANRENAIAVAFAYVRTFGTSGLRHHSQLAELYADTLSSEDSSLELPSAPMDGNGQEDTTARQAA